MEKEQIELAVGTLKLASFGVSGKLTTTMKDSLQFWAKKKRKEKKTASTRGSNPTPSFGVWP